VTPTPSISEFSERESRDFENFKKLNPTVKHVGFSSYHIQISHIYFSIYTLSVRFPTHLRFFLRKLLPMKKIHIFFIFLFIKFESHWRVKRIRLSLSLISYSSLLSLCLEDDSKRSFFFFYVTFYVWFVSSFQSSHKKTQSIEVLRIMTFDFPQFLTLSRSLHISTRSLLSLPYEPRFPVTSHPRTQTHTHTLFLLHYFLRVVCFFVPIITQKHTIN